MKNLNIAKGLCDNYKMLLKVCLTIRGVLNPSYQMTGSFQLNKLINII